MRDNCLPIIWNTVLFPYIMHKGGILQRLSPSKTEVIVSQLETIKRIWTLEFVEKECWHRWHGRDEAMISVSEKTSIVITISKNTGCITFTLSWKIKNQFEVLQQSTMEHSHQDMWMV